MDNLEQISNSTIERYTKRYQLLGYNVKTLGWGTTEQQAYRFSQTLDSNLPFKNKVVLDIGCGFGDYLQFLIDNKIDINQYIGYDINENLINEARKRHPTDLSNFVVENILETNQKDIADIGIMFGVLNFNLKDKMNNMEYSKHFIKKAFALVKEVLIVDFLSTKIHPSYPEEDFVYYHSPEKVLEFAFTLSNNVVLKHNYAPIPQKEFMLFIYKD